MIQPFDAVSALRSVVVNVGACSTCPISTTSNCATVPNVVACLTCPAMFGDCRGICIKPTLHPGRAAWFLPQHIAVHLRAILVVVDPLFVSLRLNWLPLAVFHGQCRVIRIIAALPFIHWQPAGGQWGKPFRMCYLYTAKHTQRRFTGVVPAVIA